MFDSVLTIALGAILINNFIFSQFLGCCPFLGCSTKIDTALGMGLAVTFVMGLASAICYAGEHAAHSARPGVHAAPWPSSWSSPCWCSSSRCSSRSPFPRSTPRSGIYLPLITTNCAVLGVVLLNVQNNYNFIESVVYGITGGLGFLARHRAVCERARAGWSLPTTPRASTASR